MNTRIAPSPTGKPHIGLIRTAYFNWLAARSTNGKFILRIDDTDTERSKVEHINEIIEAMDWLGLDYDEIEKQSCRHAIYRDYLDRISNNIRKTEDGAIVLIPTETRDFFVDEIAGKISTSGTDKDYIEHNIVLWRSRNGGPTYHFASVVDDIEMKIDCVIRGVDHISNTARQIAIYDTLNQQIPKYHHIGLIHKDGKPLSKRDGAASILQYKADGINPDAMLNFLARMGWGPNVDDKSTSILTREDMLRMFWNEGHMRSQPSGLDIAKLASFNRKHNARNQQDKR